MVFWTTIISTLKEEQKLTEAPCPLCGQKGHLKMEAYSQRTENLFWNTDQAAADVKLSCGACRRDVPRNKLTPELKSSVEEMAQRNRGRFRMRPSKILVVLLLVIVAGVATERVQRATGYNPSDTPEIRTRNAVHSALFYPMDRTVLAVALASEGFDEVKTFKGHYALIEAVGDPTKKGDYPETPVTVRLSKVGYDNPDFYDPKAPLTRGDFGDEALSGTIKTSLKTPLVLQDPKTGKTLYFKVLNARSEVLTE